MYWWVGLSAMTGDVGDKGVESRLYDVENDEKTPVSCNRDNDPVPFLGRVGFRDAPCEYGLTRLPMSWCGVECFCGNGSESLAEEERSLKL